MSHPSIYLSLIYPTFVQISLSILFGLCSAFGYLKSRGCCHTIFDCQDGFRRLVDGAGVCYIVTIGSWRWWRYCVSNHGGSCKTIDPTASYRLTVLPILWERGVMSMLHFFILNVVRPHEDVIIGPIILTLHSVKCTTSTTQRLLSLSTLRIVGLPLNRDWTLTPLDYLLLLCLNQCPSRGASPFLFNIFHPDVRGRIWILEYGQPQNDSAEEVFRDGIVQRFMEDILRLLHLWGFQ